MHKEVYVVLGDMVDSRNSDREGLAPRLEEALAEIRKAWAQAQESPWLLPPQLIKGIDELAALASTPQAAFDLGVLVHERIWPARFRFAVARGSIDVGADSKDITKLDGTAFHRAADALRWAHQEGQEFRVDDPDLGPGERGLLHAGADLHGCLHRELTRTQIDTLRIYRLEGTQAATARAQGKSQPTVSKSLKASHAAELLAMEDAIRAALTHGGPPAPTSDE